MRLVIGRGHLGSYLHSCMPGSTHYTDNMLSLSASEASRFDVIINAAGKTDLKACEERPLEAWASNVEGPLHVFRLAKAAGATYIHISSGCLWDGPYDGNGEPFLPCAPVSPASFYAWTKASVDALLVSEAKEDDKLVILRPRQLYSGINSPRNTLVKLRGYASLIDTPNSMTSVSTVKATIDRVIGAPYMLNHVNGPFWVMNVYDIGITTPYQVGMMLYEAGLRGQPDRLEKSELDVWHKPRRVDAVLKDACFEALVSPPTVRDELRRNIVLLATTLVQEEIDWARKVAARHRIS